MVDTFFRTDREGRIMMISPSVTNLLGVTPEEALGRRFDEFVAVPNTMPNLYELVVSGSDETTGHEIRMVRQDGDEVWVLTTARKFLDEDGEAAGIEGVAHRHHHAQTGRGGLGGERGAFRDFAEASSDWMWETDADGRFSYISERIVDVLGIKPGQILGRKRDDLANDGQVNADWSRYRRQIDQQKPFRDFQYDSTGSDGEPELSASAACRGLPRTEPSWDTGEPETTSRKVWQRNGGRRKPGSVSSTPSKRCLSVSPSMTPKTDWCCGTGCTKPSPRQRAPARRLLLRGGW